MQIKIKLNFSSHGTKFEFLVRIGIAIFHIVCSIPTHAWIVFPFILFPPDKIISFSLTFLQKLWFSCLKSFFFFFLVPFEHRTLEFSSQAGNEFKAYTMLNVGRFLAFLQQRLSVFANICLSAAHRDFLNHMANVWKKFYRKSAKLPGFPFLLLI